MPDRRGLRVDGVAWFLLFCGLVVAVCVLSHEPAASGTYAPNLLGMPGHWLACELHSTLGSAVHVLLVAWFVLVLMLLIQKSWLRWSGLRLIDFDGYAPDRTARTLRLLGTCVSLCAGGMGLAWALFDEEQLGWNDHMSKTFPTIRV
jgi:hypothetical protein